VAHEDSLLVIFFSQFLLPSPSEMSTAYFHSPFDTIYTKPTTSYHFVDSSDLRGIIDVLNFYGLDVGSLPMAVGHACKVDRSLVYLTTEEISKAH